MESGKRWSCDDDLALVHTAYVKAAFNMYEEIEGSEFNFENCWRLLRDLPKWREVIPFNTVKHTDTYHRQKRPRGLCTEL